MFNSRMALTLIATSIITFCLIMAANAEISHAPTSPHRAVPPKPALAIAAAPKLKAPPTPAIRPARSIAPVERDCCPECYCAPAGFTPGN